ncbi:hypothetical protein BaRGS_00019738 [Batillaria attramentaria]|uniref:Uncharacterized protein n=1 Tax=Batillaria attramentaria TaxID=370345 RepID=A0ABD0KPF9_9CAEN
MRALETLTPSVTRLPWCRDQDISTPQALERSFVIPQAHDNCSKSYTAHSSNSGDVPAAKTCTASATIFSHLHQRLVQFSPFQSAARSAICQRLQESDVAGCCQVTVATCST